MVAQRSTSWIPSSVSAEINLLGLQERWPHASWGRSTGTPLPTQMTRLCGAESAAESPKMPQLLVSDIDSAHLCITL